MTNGKINHYCVICGKGYHACDSCLEERQFTPWKTLTDTSNHFQIYSTLSMYNGNFIDKAEARKRLSRRDLRDKDTFKESVRNTIDEIMDEPKPTRRATKRPIVETATIADKAILTTDIADSADTNDCEQN